MPMTCPSVSRPVKKTSTGRGDRIIPPTGGLCELGLRPAWRARAQAVEPGFSSCRSNRGDRIRNCRSPSKHQRLTEDDTLIDTLGPRERAEVCEVVSVWPKLPHALREGILAIVRSSREVPAALGCSDVAIPPDTSPPSKSGNPRQTRSHLPGPAERGRQA
jgi:hypothetical protein